MADNKASGDRSINKGLPAVDPAAVAEKQASHVQGDVATGGAAGASVGGLVGAVGGPAAAVTGAAAGALSGAVAGAVVATERGPAGDAVNMGEFKEAAVGPGAVGGGKREKRD
ncbi:hypothetical protein MNEG_1734 [Monoraphidium neglectum]|jgi:hypothetical protein|uniref:Glycine zipper domain-containing protein n=1 Tax=Monoraphidium neglectum TaxID=145388 RepID=A0A0D2N130_9CHLO|nr:hypothetical protein MNEG_1734 [Monoraphidium neglectum]KIZ06222.1 hypothetical protein MNEG_1734 [Monoraphidium neglectum]|eukprot:XP_013905241.1 hypothetical protein MNEG_1734 [Monoraphidium neglectum]